MFILVSMEYLWWYLWWYLWNIYGISMIQSFWLVVYLPLWKIWKSIGMMTFPTHGKTIQSCSSHHQYINLTSYQIIITIPLSILPSLENPILNHSKPMKLPLYAPKNFQIYRPLGPPGWFICSLLMGSSGLGRFRDTRWTCYGSHGKWPWKSWVYHGWHAKSYGKYGKMAIEIAK